LLKQITLSDPSGFLIDCVMINVRSSDERHQTKIVR